MTAAEDGPVLRVNLNQVKIEIRRMVANVTNDALSQAYAEAERLVPVRKVFKGSRRLTNTSSARFLSRREAEAELGVRRQLGMVRTGRRASQINEIMQVQTLKEPTRQSSVPSNPFLRNVRRFNRPGTMEQRQVRQRAGGYQLINAGPGLSARGRWELRSGRAISRADMPQRSGNVRRPGMANARATLGGRLKREIEIHEASARQPVVKGSVVSPTYYARFVEFGTRHAAAQPYMRPALASVRETYRAQIMAAVKRGGKMKRRHVRTGGAPFGR